MADHLKPDEQIQRPRSIVARKIIGRFRNKSTRLQSIQNLIERIESGEYFPRSKRIAILKSLAKKLYDIHSHGLATGFMSPNNCLYNTESLESFIDVPGLILDGDWSYESIAGRYAAPELKCWNGPYSESSDVYTFSAIALSLLSATENSKYSRIRLNDSAKLPNKFLIQETVDEEIKKRNKQTEVQIKKLEKAVEKNDLDCFKLLFIDSITKNSYGRPNIEQWIRALEDYESERVTCLNCSSMVFPGEKCSVCGADLPKSIALSMHVLLEVPQYQSEYGEIHKVKKLSRSLKKINY